ncbi:hypothetical protein LG943_19885 [Streptomonospora sp. S1-112]|uniref:Uncharacterized protein n=1 Tax=Streptomonospora mangrovi TaxID=2883123 RepID=A0A9X3NQK6_9ACTN|nr:hypothetical protein [Streptomonospora mangrovi]MDA0566553.1 hypothetical protein [Streptomonospora mangrovi]
MPTTGRTRRTSRLAAAVRAAGRTPARRWLLVAGVLAGAWFAGAAPAAADAALHEHLGQGAGAASQRVADTPAPVAHGAGGAAAEAAAPAASGTSAEAPARPARAGTPPVAERPDPVPPVPAAAEPEAPAPAPAADTAPGSGGASGNGSGGGSARASGGDAPLRPAVDAVRGIGRDAGRAVPLKVGPPDHAAADAVPGSGAAHRASAGLPDLGMSPFAPGLGRDTVALPALDLTGASAARPGADTQPHADDHTARRTGGDRHARSAPNGAAAPAAGTAAAFAAPASGAAAEPSADTRTGSAPEPVDPPASAATVGSAPQAPQYGGFCAGYLPAASAAAPAAGPLPCERRALAAAPRDLGGEPTFSPD